jgi:RNA polymerase sigma-70 factor, ECF subfamily
MSVKVPRVELAVGEAETGAPAGGPHAAEMRAATNASTRSGLVISPTDEREPQTLHRSSVCRLLTRRGVATIVGAGGTAVATCNLLARQPPLQGMQTTIAASGLGALESLYRSDGDRIWRAVWAFAHDPELASDAVAEAFAQALARGHAIRSPAAWVWHAAFRIAAGMLQDRRRNLSLDSEIAYEMAGTNAELLWALQQLPKRQRAAVILFYYADHPIREVAAILDSSLIAVRVNLSRGRRRLRQILETSNG